MNGIDAPLAIVGLGARGLHALELFYITLSRKQNQINHTAIIFEPRENLGCGFAWDVDQDEIAISNISDRALETLEGRETFTINDVQIERFPSYWEWLAIEKNVVIQHEEDTFSSRKTTGQYLNQRANSLVKTLLDQHLIEIVDDKVVAVDRDQMHLNLTTSRGKSYQCSDVILALGHLKAQASDEDSKISQHAATHDLLFAESPYSSQVSDFAAHGKIIVKGLGLAMIDVVRKFTSQKLSNFQRSNNSIYLEYRGDLSLQLIPYSLDGLPPVPKPIGKQIDDHFDPLKHKSKKVLDELFAKIDHGLVNNLDDILTPIARLTMNIYKSFKQEYSKENLSTNDGIDILLNWYRNHEIAHTHIIDTRLDVVDYMKVTCEMSYGLRPFSLDYTAGQVWRYLQIEMYKVYRHGHLSNQLISEYINVNERAKRYSFGPPVESILQLIALADAQILNLEFARNPDLILDNDQFELKLDGKLIQARCFINAVLPKPDLSNIEDSLISALSHKNYIHQFYNGLGIAVDSHASAISSDASFNNIYVIGRNAKGSDYGIDAILECFNKELTQSVIDSILK